MNVAQLAYACHIYGISVVVGTDYDDSYNRFLLATSGACDLHQPEHCEALLVWLNQWLCRQFRPTQYAEAASRLSEWYARQQSQLVGRGRPIQDLSDAELDSICAAYGDLKDITASHRRRNGKDIAVRVGPTGAAKTLFALRPPPPYPGTSLCGNTSGTTGRPAPIWTF